MDSYRKCVNSLPSHQIWYELVWTVDCCEGGIDQHIKHIQGQKKKSLMRTRPEITVSHGSHFFQCPRKQDLKLPSDPPLLTVVNILTVKLIFHTFRVVLRWFCACAQWTLSWQGKAEVFRDLCQPPLRLRPRFFCHPALTYADLESKYKLWLRRHATWFIQIWWLKNTLPFYSD